MPESKLPPQPPKQAPARSGSEVGLRVSLIPVEDKKQADPRVGFRKFIAATGAGLFLFMAGAGYLVYRYYSDLSAVRGLNAEIAAVKARSEDLGDSLKDAKRIQTRLRAIGGLLENRRIDSPLFVFLEKHVQANVTFSGLAAGENNAVSLTAVSGSFEDYAAQIDELKAQKEIKSVTTSGLNVRYDEQDRLAAVDFSLTVAFDPAFFKPAK